MERIEKTVFISYRRATAQWTALAIFQDLTQHGYDVFIDYDGLASGNFETNILENIKARAHFLVLLTPTALERVGDPNDWMRREIEAALDSQRNIVPLMLEGFTFGAPAIASQLSGRLVALKECNGLEIPKSRFFSSEMERLRNKFLNVPVDAVLHPPSDPAKEVAKEQKDKAGRAVAELPHWKGDFLWPLTQVASLFLLFSSAVFLFPTHTDVHVLAHEMVRLVHVYAGMIILGGGVFLLLLFRIADRYPTRQERWACANLGRKLALFVWLPAVVLQPFFGFGMLLAKSDFTFRNLFPERWLALSVVLYVAASLLWINGFHTSWEAAKADIAHGDIVSLKAIQFERNVSLSIALALYHNCLLSYDLS
jgi:hypothetical protein